MMLSSLRIYEKEQVQRVLCVLKPVIIECATSCCTLGNCNPSECVKLSCTLKLSAVIKPPSPYKYPLARLKGIETRYCLFCFFTISSVIIMSTQREVRATKTIPNCGYAPSSSLVLETPSHCCNMARCLSQVDTWDFVDSENQF